MNTNTPVRYNLVFVDDCGRETRLPETQGYDYMPNKWAKFYAESRKLDVHIERVTTECVEIYKGGESLTPEEADILAHTSRTGRYVGEGHRLMDLARRGLLHDHGAQALAGGAHYLTLSTAGRAALNAWRAAQPPPTNPKPTRQSREFRGWREYCEACGSISFRDYLKRIKQNRI